MIVEPTDSFFDVYGREFWDENGSKGHRDAQHAIGKALYEFGGKPNSVLDVGCGTGQMLAGMIRAAGGILSVTGIESKNGIEWCKKLAILEITESELIPHDLREPMPELYNFDMVICCEVCEHLPEATSNEVIRWICEEVQPKVLAFSGATPNYSGHQVIGFGGTGHINERPTPVWMGLIRKNGYKVDWEASERFHYALRNVTYFHWIPNIYLYRPEP